MVDSVKTGMGENIKTGIIIVTFLLTLFTSYSANVSTKEVLKNEVTMMQKELDKIDVKINALDNAKADNAMLNLIINRLDRIERKLDTIK